MLRYAGIDLLSDPEGELAAVRERVRMDRLALFGPPVRPQESEVGDAQPRCPLPKPNYPAPPAIELNQLYWPTGAARWSHFVGIIEGPRLEKILEATKGGRSEGKHLPAQFVIGESEFGRVIADDDVGGFKTDSDGRYAIATELYMLPPRPVVLSSPAADAPDPDCYLLPLVDERYFWQWRSMASRIVGAGESRTDEPDLETWAGWVEALDETLGIELDLPTDIADEYFRPDKTSLNLLKQNAAVLLDAVALSCGRRVVREFDGTVALMSPETALERHKDNVASGRWVAGGPITLVSGSLRTSLVASDTTDDYEQHEAVPAHVDVVFRKLVEEADPSDTDADGPDPYDDAKVLYGPATRTIRNPAAIFNHQRTIEGAVKTIRTPSWVGRVFYDANGAAGTPAACDEPAGAIDLDWYGDRYFRLAKQISQDWYAWRHQHDYAAHGVHKWRPTGFDDCILIDASGGTIVQRCTSLPHDFGVESQLVQVHRQADFNPRELTAIVSGEWTRYPLELDRNDACLTLNIDSVNQWHQTGEYKSAAARPLIPTDPHAHEDSPQYGLAMIDGGVAITAVTRSQLHVRNRYPRHSSAVIYLRKNGDEWQVIEQDPEANYGTIRVRNDYAFTLPRYAPVGLDGPIQDPSLTEFTQETLDFGRILSCTKPAMPRHRARFAVLTQSLEPCEIGTAVLSGVVPSRVIGADPAGRVQRPYFVPQPIGDDAPLSVRRGAFHELTDQVATDDSHAMEIHRTAWWGNPNPHTGPSGVGAGPDCTTGTCDFVCSQGVWQVTTQDCPSGCVCDTIPEKTPGLFPMPCSDAATVSLTNCSPELDPSAMAMIRMGNDAYKTGSGLSVTEICEYTTCTYACTETSPGTWEWTVSNNECAYGCDCPAVPSWYTCANANSCPVNVTLACAPPPPTSTTSTTAPPTTSCAPAIAPCTDTSCCQWECYGGSWVQTNGCSDADCCCDERPTDISCTDGQTFDSACAGRDCDDTDACQFVLEQHPTTSAWLWKSKRDCCKQFGGCPCCAPQNDWHSPGWWANVTIKRDCGDCCTACSNTDSSQRCTWTYSGGSWSLTSDTCPSRCHCKSPPSEAMASPPTEGTTREMKCCNGSTTTTSTSGPPTTTTSTSAPPTTTTTTTTTATPFCVGGCDWEWDGASWFIIDDNCSYANESNPQNCECCYPTVDGTTVGETLETSCKFRDDCSGGDPTTTTTSMAPPTTTTTTTSTTTTSMAPP